jgi:hypothetical protein
MREKLFYLMTDSKCPAFFLNNEQVLALADHLIENGVVIPVRCRECKHRDEDGDICYYHSSFGDDKICYTYPDGYCSYGKPREKDEE